jgi:hypothetical protein
MYGVFQIIDPHPPSPPGEFVAGGGQARWVERGEGGGVNNLEDARHSSVLHICKYFVGSTFGRHTQILQGFDSGFSLKN